MKHFVWALALTLCVPLTITAQRTPDEDSGRSPYELMSSYYSEDFKPFNKGNIYTGLSFSLRDRSLINVDQLIQNVVDGEETRFSLLAKGGYYTGNYGMLGLSFEYSQDEFEGTLFRDPDTVLSESISRNYIITPYLRSSIPLSANERLSFFTEIGLSLGFGNSLQRNTRNIDDIEKVYADNFSLRLGLSPGVTFFAIENFAFEFQLNVLGYELNVLNEEINGVDQSREVRQNIDFNLDILSLRLGLAYYFGAKKTKK